VKLRINALGSSSPIPGIVVKRSSGEISPSSLSRSEETTHVHQTRYSPSNAFPYIRQVFEHFSGNALCNFGKQIGRIVPGSGRLFFRH